jgi:hypothetical protein
MPAKKKAPATRKPAAPRSKLSGWFSAEYSPEFAMQEFNRRIPNGQTLYRCSFFYKDTRYYFDIVGNDMTPAQLQAEALTWVKKNRGENG